MMNNLVRVIGQAPSEVLEEFLIRLKAERLRVSQALQDIKERRRKLSFKKTAKAKPTKKEIVSLLQGVDDLDDFFKFVKSEMEKKDDRN